MLDRVTGLQVLVRVAGLGSLSAAARALGMSQTMATKHMAALETHLGVKLLHRSTRRVSLTEAGRSYLEAAERILSELDEADATARRETLEVKGTVRINAPVSYGVRAIAPLLPELSRRYPDLRIELGLNDRYVDLVEEGWDIAVRIGTLKDSALRARRLAPCPTVVCAAPSYLASQGTPRTIADLARHNCLGYTLSQSVGADRWTFGATRPSSVAVCGNLRANNGDALVLAALAGQGVIYTPRFLVESELAAGLLVALKLDREPLELGGIYALSPPDRRPPAKIRATIDFLAEHLSPRARGKAPRRGLP